MKTAIITGATAGIGLAVAHTLAKEGYNLILTGRRKDVLLKVSQEIIDSSQSTGLPKPIEILPLAFDVRSQKQVEDNLGNLPAKWQDVSVLVNNAGLAVGLNPIQNGIVDDWERMIDTNIKGLLYVSHVVSNLMIQRKGGHIINLCSIAGKEVYTNGNVYCATKHAVNALTQGMRLDLLPYGIKVSQVCPGAVETEFSLVRFKGDAERAAKVYQGYTPLTASDIAYAIDFIINCPSHMNINDMVIMPTAQANASITYKGN